MSEPAIPASAAAPYGAPGASPARRPGLGRIALLVGVLLFVVSVTVSVLMAHAAAPHVEIGPNGFDAVFSSNDPDPDVRALAAATAAHAVLGGLFGFWAIIQGILAVATNRGRLPGAFAIVLGVITPGISLAVYLGVLFVVVQSA